MWLGAGHPLVQSLSRSETACQQLVPVTAAGAPGVVWYVGDWSFGLSLAMAAAVQSGSRSQLIHPLADRRLIRAVAPDLREAASLLRGDPAVHGVALVEWLLTSPATPLYGSEVEPLRAELRRARYLISHS
jgi:hypothetical protein